MSEDVTKRRRLVIRGTARSICNAKNLDEPGGREEIAGQRERQIDSTCGDGAGDLHVSMASIRERGLPRCLARTWSGGSGSQCTRRVMCATKEYCTQHQQQAESRKGLAHGRIDEPMAIREASNVHLVEQEGKESTLQPHARDQCPQPMVKYDHHTLQPHVRDQCPQPMVKYDRNRCAARVWAGGRGSQCTRKVMDSCDFCAHHKRDYDSQHGLAHGRIDQLVPDAKVQEFMNAQTSLGSLSSESESSSMSSDSESESARSKDTIQKYSNRPTSFRLPEVCCILIFEYLSQGSLFRSAMVFRFWNHVIKTSRPFRILDFRPVGVWLTGRGRRACLAPEAREAALWSFAAQKRFSNVFKLDLRGVPLGRENPERSSFLEHLSTCCPLVRHILLHQAGPREIWCDLGRSMPAAFARSLLKWWPGITDDEMIIECSGRHYYIAGGIGVSPRVRVQCI